MPPSKCQVYTHQSHRSRPTAMREQKITTTCSQAHMLIGIPNFKPAFREIRCGSHRMHNMTEDYKESHRRMGLHRVRTKGFPEFKIRNLRSTHKTLTIGLLHGKIQLTRKITHHKAINTNTTSLFSHRYRPRQYLHFKHQQCRSLRM